MQSATRMWKNHRRLCHRHLHRCLEGQLYFDKKMKVHHSTADQKTTFKVKIWREVQKVGEKSSTEHRKHSIA